MNFRKLTPLIFMTVAIATVISCKEDEDTEVLPSLDGTLSFHAPKYIAPNQTLKMTPSGISHPDGEGIGYYWKVSPGMTESDTTRLENGLSPDGTESDGSFTYKFPDSLATYTVSCYGFAQNYSSAYASRLVSVVKGGLNGSITGTGIAASDPNVRFKGTPYYYTSRDGMDWFRNNLADPSAGVPHANAAAMTEVFGIYYSYEEAMNACPEGWRLPTDAEWTAFARSLNEEYAEGDAASEHEVIPGVAAALMANAEFNTYRMWEYWPQVGEITNESELAFIPAGYANLGTKDEDGTYPAATFAGTYDYAVFWTADKVEGEEGMAYYRYVIDDQPDMLIGKGDTKTFGASVRCIRNNR